MSECADFITNCQEVLVELKEFRDEIESYFDVTNIKTAKKIMGSDNFLGPKEVFNTFGVKLKRSEIPPIPFSKRELETAAELNQKMILRIGTAKDGAPLTIKKMEEELLREGFYTGDEILFNVKWCRDEGFFIAVTPASLKAQWALISMEVIPDSTNKNYLEQTEVLVDFLQTEIMPTLSKSKKVKYEEAIAEFNSKKEMIQGLMDGWLLEEAGKQLVRLKSNQMTRQTASQALYDMLLTLDNKSEILLAGGHAWTTARDFSGKLVYVSCSRSVGAVYADQRFGDLGASFSRTI